MQHAPQGLIAIWRPVGLMTMVATLLVACGGGGGGDAPAPQPERPLATPTLANPVRDAGDKLALLREADTLAATALDAIKPHRTAESSFGPIPKEAPRLNRQTVTVNGQWTGYLPTGLYVPPGELVTVTVPAVLVGKGYVLRISGHVDALDDAEAWSRMPKGIQSSFVITEAKTTIASPYGGALYIDVGDEADGKVARQLGPLAVEVSGAIEAPYFVLGVHTNAQWAASLRQRPAPYAELVTERVAVSVPSSMVRNTADIEALLRYWDDVVALQDWVGGTEAYRTGPDRINFDVQIGAGYLHAGYPIQGPATAASSMQWVDLDWLRTEGEWGYFHELGHEMQRQGHIWGGAWQENGFTPSGMVEVTANIFAKIAMDRMAPFPSLDQGSGWGWAPYPGQALKRAIATLGDASKPTFASRDPYPFYFILADALGWEAYRKVLSSYVADAVANSPQFPRKDADKYDQWLIRWSKVTGFDLVDYMVTRWKWPASDTAVQTVRAMGLPNWMPATSSIDNFRFKAGSERVLDLRGTGFDLDGAAPFVRVQAGAKLSLTENGDGKFTLRAQPGALGRDALQLVYRSRHGNEVTTTLQVEILPGG